MRFIRPTILFAVVIALSAGTAASQPPAAIKQPAEKKTADSKPPKPVGTWVREINSNGMKVKITLTVKDDTLQVIYGDSKSPSYYFLDCDYGITKDFVVFGVVNSVDGEPGDRPTDKPFRFRYRLDDTALTIKDVSMENCPSVVSRMEGRYTRVPEKK